MTRAGRAPSAWLNPVVLKKPSPELPFKKIGQNTHVIIHSISLKIPTGWLKKPSPEFICFWMDTVLLSWSCIFKGHPTLFKVSLPPAQVRGDPVGCTTIILESLAQWQMPQAFSAKPRTGRWMSGMWNPPCHFLSCPGEPTCQMFGCALLFENHQSLLWLDLS